MKDLQMLLENGEARRRRNAPKMEDLQMLLDVNVNVNVNVYVIGHSPSGLFRTNANK